MAFLSFSQNAFYKWRDASLTDDLWVGWEALILNLVGTSGGKAFWRERAYVFGTEFRDPMQDVIMQKQPDPAARPLGAFDIS
jgi:hypothetical protein